MLSKRFLGIPAAGLLAIAVACLCLRITPSSQGAPAETSPRVDFLRDIQPVFQASCISCHGHEQQMAGLRLDSRSLALAGGQSGRAIEPGDADGSLLLQRVAGLGDQARMPMGGKPLDPETIELIREWIEQGADWPETSGENGAAVERHWAYVPPSRPELPKVRDASWVVNPIDAFVLARLEAQGLAPSPVADRVTLLRRLSLDLIGLPPTIDEVDAFLADDSSEAYRNQVERLLGSPHYGERWGRRWLDAARYADSDGFEKDLPRIVWFYRDWVIGALNRDLPYDRFIVEQLAGDMLPGATQDQMVATGYLRNSMMNLEGGIDPEQFRMEAMFDRMEAVGKGILGITIQCAQCHNHKYDPLTQEEYYRLFSFLNNAHEAKIAVYTPEEQRLRETLRREIRDVELELQQSHPDWRARMDAWERGLDHDPPQWTVVQPEVDDFSTQGQGYLPLEDGSFLAQGATGGSHRVKMTIRTDHRPIAAFRLELMTDGDLPMGGPGRSINGTCALSEFEVEAAPAGHPDQVRPVKMASATADIVPAPLELTPTEEGGEPRVIGPVALAIDGKEETAWGVDTGTVLRNQPRKAVFRPEQPIDHADGTLLTFYLTQKHAGGDDQGTGNRNLGRFRLSITGEAGAEADPLPKRVREVLSIESARRTPEQIREVFSYWRTTVPEWSRFNDRIEDLWRQHPKGTTQLVLSERQRLRPTHVLARGDFLRPGKRVGPGVPAFLNPLTEKRSRRPAGVRPLAGGPQGSHNGAHPGQSGLAGVFRHRPGAEQRGPGEAERATLSSQAAGLACGRVHGAGVESQVPASTHRDFGHLPPVIPGDSPTVPRGSLQPPAGPGPAISRGRRGGPRHCSGSQRSASPRGWRSQRLLSSTQVSLRSARQLQHQGVGRGPGTEPLPARDLHVPLQIGALPHAPDLRRTQRRVLLRAPASLQHAPAGADDSQRTGLPGSGSRPGPAHAARRGKRPGATTHLRLSPLPGATTHPGRGRPVVGFPERTEASAGRRMDQPLGSGRVRSPGTSAVAGRDHPGPVGRLDGRVARPAEPG